MRREWQQGELWMKSWSGNNNRGGVGRKESGRAQAAGVARPVKGDYFLRKFASSFSPCSVRKLSGWYCTPSKGQDLWRTPMISSAAVQLLISNSGGSVPLRMMRLW